MAHYDHIIKQLDRPVNSKKIMGNDLLIQMGDTVLDMRSETGAVSELNSTFNAQRIKER